MTTIINNFPEFKDIKVSTKTYTANTNIVVDIHKLYDVLEVTPYIVTPKKRGRKPKAVTLVDVNQDIPYGSIVTVKCEGKIKGVELKPKSPKKMNSTSYFRNSVTIVILLDKPINFKVCSNGTLQMTGCKTWEHASECVKRVWEVIRVNPDMITYTRGDPADGLDALIIPSMRNIDFDAGFLIDRDKLSQRIHASTEMHCLLETAFGYTGVNIKIPLTDSRDGMMIKRLKCSIDGVNTLEPDVYRSYLDVLDVKTRAKKDREKKYNTFLVFHSGKIIFSGLASSTMEDTYNMFVQFIGSSYEQIVERLII